jgi:prevent-host-death family protein
MTRVELKDATSSLSDYTRKARKGPVVVTRRGKPVALLRILGEDEWEACRGPAIVANDVLHNDDPRALALAVGRWTIDDVAPTAP